MADPVKILVLLTGESPDKVKTLHGGFGQLFGEVLRGSPVEGGVDVSTLDVTGRDAADPLPDLAGVDGVVMSGSAAMVGDDTPWMRWSVKTVRHLVDEERPFLGVCFGHQLLGVAMGADVGPNPRGREMGTVEVHRRGLADDLLDRLPGSFAAQVSHRDVIRDPGPRLTVLAEADHDPCHAVRAGPAAWGVQFHPEFTAGVMRGYLEARERVFDDERGPGATRQRLDAVRDTADGMRTLQHFVALAQERRGGPRGR